MLCLIFIWSFIIGLGFMIAAICIHLVQFRSKKLCTVCVEAEIIDLIRHDLMEYGDRNRMIRYHPIFRYNFEGETFQVEHYMGYPKGKDKIGDIVKIKINPYKPIQIYRDGNTLQFIFKLFYIIGFLFLCISLEVLWLNFSR